VEEQPGDMANNHNRVGTDTVDTGMALPDVVVVVWVDFVVRLCRVVHMDNMDTEYSLVEKQARVLMKWVS